MPSRKTSALPKGRLFANDESIPSDTVVEQSVQKTLNDTQSITSNQQDKQFTSSSSAHNAKLGDFLDNENPIYQLANKINWHEIGQELGTYYQYRNHDYEIRPLLAMYMLSVQHNYHHSITLSLWLENPYWQFFCGMTSFTTVLPFDISVLESFEEYVNKHQFKTLKDLEHRLSALNLQSIKVASSAIEEKNESKKLKKTFTKRPTFSTLQPVSVHWYQDYLFYVYFLLAIGFWVIYALIFPVNWPQETLTWKQWQAFSYIVIGYPIVEEIIFRGGIQGWLHRYEWAKVTTLGISVANVLVSIIFAVLHIIIRPDDKTAYGIIIPSLIFGLFRDRHKHIISCTLLHVFYNMGIFFLFIMPHIK